jgi:hypothetical protein
VTSYERRGRADGPTFDRGNFTTAARENQHPRPANQAIVGRSPVRRQSRTSVDECGTDHCGREFPERLMNSRVAAFERMEPNAREPHPWAIRQIAG